MVGMFSRRVSSMGCLRVRIRLGLDLRADEALDAIPAGVGLQPLAGFVWEGAEVLRLRPAVLRLEAELEEGALRVQTEAESWAGLRRPIGVGQRQEDLLA